MDRLKRQLFKRIKDKKIDNETLKTQLHTALENTYKEEKSSQKI